MSVLQKKIRPLFSAFFSAGKYHKQEHTEKKEDSTRKKLSSEPDTFKFKINAADPGAYPNVHP